MCEKSSCQNGKIKLLKKNKHNYSPVLDWCAWSSIITAIMFTIESSWGKQERDWQKGTTRYGRGHKGDMKIKERG